jgi:hypothetical protein
VVLVVNDDLTYIDGGKPLTYLEDKAFGGPMISSKGSTTCSLCQNVTFRA